MIFAVFLLLLPWTAVGIEIDVIPLELSRRESETTVKNIFCDFAPRNQLTVSNIIKLLEYEEFDFQTIYDVTNCPRQQTEDFLSLAENPMFHKTLFKATKLLNYFSPIAVDIFLKKKISYKGTILLKGIRRQLYGPVSLIHPELERVMLESAMGQLERTESITWLHDYLYHAKADEIVRMFKLAPPDSLSPILLAPFLRKEVSSQILDIYLLPTLSENELLIRTLIVIFTSLYRERWEAIDDQKVSTMSMTFLSDDAQKICGFAKDLLTPGIASNDDFIEAFDYLITIVKELDTISAWSVIGEIQCRWKEQQDHEENNSFIERVDVYLKEISPSRVSPLEFRHGFAIFIENSLCLSQRFPSSYLSFVSSSLEIKRKKWIKDGPVWMLSKPTMVFDVKSLFTMAFNEGIVPSNVWLNGQWVGDYLISNIGKSLAFIASLEIEDQEKVFDPDVVFYSCAVIFLSWPYLILKKEKVDFSVLFDDLEEEHWGCFFALLAVKVESDAVSVNMKILWKVMSMDKFELPSLRELIDSSYCYMSQ